MTERDTALESYARSRERSREAVGEGWDVGSRCPTCGQGVRVVSGDEGTQGYVGAERAAARAEAVAEIREAVEGLPRLAPDFDGRMLRASDGRWIARSPVLALLAADRAEPVGLDVERLREAARRAGLPREVSVADIENVAAEYARLAAAPGEREARTPCPTCPHWMEVHNPDGTCGCGAHG